MRITHLLYAMCLFFLTACSPKEQAKEVEGEAEIQTSKTMELSCTSTSYQVYQKTVEMWHESWLWAHETNGLAESIVYTFSHDRLEELKMMFPETSGLRIYYCMNEGDDIPMLALVNIIGCKDQFQSTENSVLLSDGNGGHFISTDSAAMLTANWQSFSCTKRPFYTPVNAYNYNWEIIDDIQGLGINSEQELHISFGLRSISPGDDWFDPQGLTHKGSIVYVNILHGTGLLANSEHDFDFTMPCPQYCDSESPLFNVCSN